MTRKKIIALAGTVTLAAALTAIPAQAASQGDCVAKTVRYHDPYRHLPFPAAAVECNNNPSLVYGRAEGAVYPRDVKGVLRSTRSWFWCKRVVTISGHGQRPDTGKRYDYRETSTWWYTWGDESSNGHQDSWGFVLGRRVMWESDKGTTVTRATIHDPAGASRMPNCTFNQV